MLATRMAFLNSGSSLISLLTCMISLAASTSFGVRPCEVPALRKAGIAWGEKVIFGGVPSGAFLSIVVCLTSANIMEPRSLWRADRFFLRVFATALSLLASF